MFSAHSQQISLMYKFAYFLPYILITAVNVLPSALLGEDVDGCQATAYPCHPLQPLDVNDTETPSTYTCALSEPLTMLTICQALNAVTE